MFRVSQHPSSGVLKTVTATSGTGHNTGTATSLQRSLIGTAVLLMMGAVTPETCRVTIAVNKYLHTVASGWIFINTDQIHYKMYFLPFFLNSRLKQSTSGANIIKVLPDYS